jgi:glucosamine-6-phosphate deaminase
MVEELKAHNQTGQPTRWVLPVGPVGQYKYFAASVAEQGVSLANAWFYFMDDYCDESGTVLQKDHPLSFRRAAESQLLSRLPESAGLKREHVIFPNENNIVNLAEMIEDIGGIDTCYGGVGIHGHVAFNEPEPGVAQLGPRKVRLNDFTVTINAIRAGVGGNLPCFPRYAFTLGMPQILNSRRIVLTCRNGTPYDWANTVLRIALFGIPGDDYPVTHIRERNYLILTDKDTLQTPKITFEPEVGVYQHVT